jgi:hypothetical protein
MGLARTLVSRLRQFLGDRRHAKRHYVRLPYSVSLATRAIAQNGARRTPTLEGHTLDLSETGIALIVPAIRIGGDYLVGDNRSLHLILELPTGPLEIDATPVRYESLDEHQTENGYLIGVRIAELQESDRDRYGEYIGKLLKGEPRI